MLGAAEGEAGEDSLYRNLSIFSEAFSLVRRVYVEEPDVEALFAGSLEGVTDGLDPLAHYVPPSGAASFERIREVGVSRSGLRVVADRGISFVLAVERGSPAAAAGLERGDILTRVDGADTRTTALWEIHAALAREAGTRVELQVLRRGEDRRVSLTLAAYEPSAAVLEEREGVPVLRIGRLDAAAAAAVRKHLAELAASGAERLIVDLRNVAGGEGQTAYDAAGAFAQGELGRLVRRGETLATFASEKPPLWSGRLVVLTNRASQGAAEILTAVLAQRAGAELVGEATFGHAGREAVRRLSSGGLLVLADAFFSGPDGVPLDQRLEPEIRVRESAGSWEESDSAVDDLILERALERVRSDERPAREARLER